MLTQTSKGTRYLTAPEVAIVAATRWKCADVQIQESFIDPLFPDLDDDSVYFNDEDTPDDGAQLAKFAGQLCYLSFGAQRTRNSGQQRLYCGRPCKRRAYAAKQKLREARELADVVDKVTLTSPQPSQPSLPHRLYAYIQLLGHTLYHVFDGWRTK